MSFFNSCYGGRLLPQGVSTPPMSMDTRLGLLPIGSLKLATELSPPVESPSWTVQFFCFFLFCVACDPVGPFALNMLNHFSCRIHFHH